MIYIVNLVNESNKSDDVIYYFTDYNMAKSEFNRIVKLNQTDNDKGKYDNNVDKGETNIVDIVWYNNDNKIAYFFSEASDLKISEVGFMKS